MKATTPIDPAYLNEFTGEARQLRWYGLGDTVTVRSTSSVILWSTCQTGRRMTTSPRASTFRSTSGRR